MTTANVLRNPAPFHVFTRPPVTPDAVRSFAPLLTCNNHSGAERAYRKSKSNQITQLNLVKPFFSSLYKRKNDALQKLNSLLSEMIDAYEQNHGPVDDRSIFDGEITVPPHLRNMSLTNLRPNRLQSGLFGSLSRSRTFLTMPTNSRHTFHGSVPNLSHIFIDRSIDNNQINQTIDSRNGNDSRKTSRNSSQLLLNHNETSKMISVVNVSSPSLDETSRRGRQDDGGDVNGGASMGSDHKMYHFNDNNNGGMNSLTEIELRKSIEPSQTDSYITLIHTNVHNRSSGGHLLRSIGRSPLRTVSPSQNDIHLNELTKTPIPRLSPAPPSSMPPISKTTDTFHPASTYQTEEPSLNNLSKFTLPRVSLSHLPNSSHSPSASVTPTATFKRFN